VSGLSRPDALVFDIDGTLWDAAEPTACGWNRALERLGVVTRVTVEGIRSVAGTPFLGCVQTLIPELPEPGEEELRAIDEAERRELLGSPGTLFPGVEAGLKMLSDMYPLFLVSNCQDWYLELFLESTGLRRLFTGADCNGISGLPKGAMLQRLRQGHGLQRAVYVGDTEGDHRAAAMAGMDFAFARYGFGSLLEPVLEFQSFHALREHYADVHRAGAAE